MISETCATCAAFCPNPNNDKLGWCKLFPPVLIGTTISEGGKPFGVWNDPVTSASSWCLKWEGE